MPERERLYLVVVYLATYADVSLIERLKVSVPIFLKTLESLSNGNCRQAFHSNERDLFAWVIATKHDAKHIVNQLYSPGENEPPRRAWGDTTPTAPPSGSQTHDKFLVFELGRDDATFNVNMVRDWIDRMRKTLPM